MKKSYRNSDGMSIDFNGYVVEDEKGVWIWSNALLQNIAYRCKTEHDALYSAIEHLISRVEMYKEERDELRATLDALEEALESVQSDE